MSNSKLVDYVKLSPHCTRPRNHKIDTITIHHMAGNITAETCGQVFQTRRASANYGVDGKGRVGLYVDEDDRAWSTANPANDNRAVNIEVANCAGGPDWPVTDAAYDKLIQLTADICRRNGIGKLVWGEDRAGRVNHRGGCNMTVHQDFMATSCPGPYLLRRMPQIAQAVNRLLGAETGEIRVGDIVEFTGTRHYVSSDAEKGSACRPGKAKVTAVAKNAAHPYHLIGVAGRGSVYGWVGEGDVRR